MTDNARATQIAAWLVANNFATSATAPGLVTNLLNEINIPREGRNVADHYRAWETDMIVTDLRSTRSGLINAFVNIHGDFNLATGVRNTNWFNGHSVALIGNRRWDRRGSVGTHHYTQVDYFSTVEDAFAQFRADGRRVVAAEITPDAVPITHYEWDVNSVVIYGEEQAGLSSEVLDMVDDVVYIPQRGSVRSLNVGTTSGIFTYDYSLKTGLLG